MHEGQPLILICPDILVDFLRRIGFIVNGIGKKLLIKSHYLIWMGLSAMKGGEKFI